MMISGQGKLIVITGPSGAGTSTVVNTLLTKYSNYKTVVPTTTRKPRMGEVHGEQYYFVDRTEFENAIAQDKFIEYTFYAGNYYGTGKTDVFAQIEQGKNVIMQLDPSTAHKVKSQYPVTVVVNIIPPDTNSMIQRMTEREKDDELVRERLSRYEREAYSALKADVLLVNHNPEETADYLVKAVEDSEQAKKTYEQNVALVVGMKQDIKEYLENVPRILLLHTEESNRLERLVSKLSNSGLKALNPEINLNSDNFNEDEFARVVAVEKNILFFISEKITADTKLLERFFFAWRYVKERDKRVITIVEWESVLSKNLLLKKELISANVIYPEDGLHSEQDYIEVVGIIYDIVKRAENRELLYDKIASLIKISYVPGIVSNVSKLVIDLCEEAEECVTQASRISVYKEIWKWIEILYKNGEQGYGEVWRETAHKRLDAMNRFSKMMKHSDFEQDDLYLTSYAIRALFIELQIRDECVDTLTNGDIHGLGQETKEPYYQRQRLLIEKLNIGIDRTKLSKDNCLAYSPDEVALILETNQQYLLSETSKSVDTGKHVVSDCIAGGSHLTSIAEQLAQTNLLFSLIVENSGTGELLQCLKTSYERLRKYSEIIGAKSICAECVEHIAEVNQRLDVFKQEQFENTIAESAFKALLGFKVPNSEQFDVFISYKHEDADIARSLYMYLKQNLLYPFFDSYTLPELSNSEYEEAIMDALEKSRHFVVVVSKLEYLKSFWVELEMKTFQHELNEGRKPDANFLMIVSDEVVGQIFMTNKKCLHIRYRNCEIIRISEYKERIIQYLSN